MSQLIECVPNFSEGRDLEIIKQITDEIEAVDGVQLLDVDPGKATNRTVVTFVGQPKDVIEAAYLAIKKASELIDMSKHSGEHPRMGATDVCPLVPISGTSMEETKKWAHILGKRVGAELGIPVYMYESAATSDDRKNLATVRSGEYEGLEAKLSQEKWKPDYGPAKFNILAGATAIGARDFLVAYNVNLNTTSVRRANSVAFDVREKGRLLRKGNSIAGEVVIDEKGEPKRSLGLLKSVKAIGWFIEEYGIAQISMNLTNIKITSVHEAFEACRKSARARGMRVTGSEVVGLVPLEVMLEAGRYYLKEQRRSLGISECEIVKIAVKSMGLDELSPFDMDEKIIEYKLAKGESGPLTQMRLDSFADLTASENPAPGGGSVSAYVGALGVSLGAMVANLSSHKRGWDDRWKEFSEVAVKAQEIKNRLVYLVNEDTVAFNKIIEAIRLPKSTGKEKQERLDAINAATKYAIKVPFEVMEWSYRAFELVGAMVEKGNPNSITDAGVGALCIRTAMRGAYMNVQINAADLMDDNEVQKILDKGKLLLQLAADEEARIVKLVNRQIS